MGGGTACERAAGSVGDRGVEARMLTHVAEERAVGDVTVAAQGDPPGPAALDLSHRIGCADEAVVYLDGELDIASAERAVSYVREVIDHRRGPVIVNLAAVGAAISTGSAFRHAASPTFRSVDTYQAFRAAWVGPRAGMIASRLSASVHLAREVVRPDAPRWLPAAAVGTAWATQGNQITECPARSRV